MTKKTSVNWKLIFFAWWEFVWRSILYLFQIFIPIVILIAILQGIFQIQTPPTLTESALSIIIFPASFFAFKDIFTKKLPLVILKITPKNKSDQ